MALGDRRTVTIHYRRLADSVLPNGTTLEESVRSAMSKTVDGIALANRYALRVWECGEDNYFVNNYYDGKKDGHDLVFGDILHFTRGHLQALFDAGQKDAASASVEQMPAPERKEYVHSIMHWMLAGNHAFVIQSLSLKTDTLESYLTWLLKDKTDVVPKTFQTVLASKFDEDVIGGDLADIQELVIGGVATPAPMEPQTQLQQVVTEKITAQSESLETQRTTGWQHAREILATLLGGTANVEKIMKAVPDDADLRVEVRIGYQTKKRQVSREGLKQLETGLRNIPDSQLEVRAKGGSKTADGSIRLHHTASIKLRTAQQGDEVRTGSLLDPNDVLRAMKEALEIFVANGKITDD